MLNFGSGFSSPLYRHAVLTVPMPGILSRASIAFSSSVIFLKYSGLWQLYAQNNASKNILATAENIATLLSICHHVQPESEREKINCYFTCLKKKKRKKRKEKKNEKKKKIKETRMNTNVCFCFSFVLFCFELDIRHFPLKDKDITSKFWNSHSLICLKMIDNSWKVYETWNLHIWYQHFFYIILRTLHKIIK